MQGVSKALIHILIESGIYELLTKLLLDDTWKECLEAWMTLHGDIWGFPSMGVPPVIIHFNGIFHYKPSSYGGTPIYGNPIACPY